MVDVGLDTSFLVATDVAEHPDHSGSRALLESLMRKRRRLVLAPQVLAEFVHVITDPRRFSKPLAIESALARAEHWWHAREIAHAFPAAESSVLFLRWMTENRLGRKRLLDTHLAATYHCAGVRAIATTNARDFAIFGCFQIVLPERTGSAGP